MKYSKWQIPITIVCLLSGMLLAIQLQTQGVKPALKNHDLVNLIKELEGNTFQLEDDIDDLRQEVAAIQDEKASGEVMLSSLQREISSLKDLTGLTEQSGSGILLVVDDNISGAELAKSTGIENYHPNDFIVHYTSILYLVNELKEVADAISVNNQRIVANSDIRCVGTVILVNTTRLAPPYEIRALGNQEILMEAVTSGYDYAYLQSSGFPIKITPEQELTIPAYRGSFRYNYAQSAKEGDS